MQLHPARHELQQFTCWSRPVSCGLPKASSQTPLTTQPPTSMPLRLSQLATKRSSSLAHSIQCSLQDALLCQAHSGSHDLAAGGLLILQHLELVLQAACTETAGVPLWGRQSSAGDWHSVLNAVHLAEEC